MEAVHLAALAEAERTAPPPRLGPPSRELLGLIAPNVIGGEWSLDDGEVLLAGRGHDQPQDKLALHVTTNALARRNARAWRVLMRRDVRSPRPPAARGIRPRSRSVRTGPKTAHGPPADDDPSEPGEAARLVAERPRRRSDLIVARVFVLREMLRLVELAEVDR
jgi:hypothetical protein